MLYIENLDGELTDEQLEEIVKEGLKDFEFIVKEFEMFLKER